MIGVTADHDIEVKFVMLHYKRAVFPMVINLLSIFVSWYVQPGHIKGLALVGVQYFFHIVFLVHTMGL